MDALTTLLQARPPVDGPVVGYVGADVPVEVLTAAGLHAVRLAGDPSWDTAAGDAILGRGLDPVARSILTGLLEQRYGDLAAVVVSRDCEASLRLFYALRELHRVDPACPLPPVHLVDVLHLPHRTTTRYVHAKVRQLRSVAGRWAGTDVSDAALAAAVRDHDRLRGLLAEVTALRRTRPARLTGTEFLGVVAATTALPVDRSIALLAALLTDAHRLPEHDGVRTFLTGSGHDTPHVYRALEEAGLLVVGEDHDHGDLLFHRRTDAPADPALLEWALAERYQHNGPTSARASIDDRAAHTAAAAGACDADALLSYVRVHDDAPAWDYPAQRAAPATHDPRAVPARLAVPSALIAQQPYGAVDADALAAAVAALRGAEVAA